MDYVKENSLAEQLAQTASMYLRLVTDKLTGSSELLKIQNLLLQISNIFGLQTALDGKIDEVTGQTGKIPTFASTGQLEASTLAVGGFANLSELNALTADGFYTGTGTATITGCGNVDYVYIGGGNELIFTTVNGVWYRKYASSWSVPVYVGGALSNIVVTYAEAEALVAGGNLSVGAVYSIEDFDVTGYTKIILTAATSSAFYDSGIAFLPVPKYREGVFYPLSVTIGDTDYQTLGNWQFITSINSNAIPAICYCYGKVYSTTGTTVGTVTDWILDSTNWTYISPITNPEFYVIEQHSVDYDFTNNYVKRETSVNNVSVGETVLLGTDDGFQTRYNDWATGSENGVGFNDYTNIHCRRLTKLYDVESHYGAFAHPSGVSEIDITGDVENCYALIDTGTDSAITRIYGDGSIKNIGTALRAGGFSANLSNGAVVDGFEFSVNAKWNIAKSINSTNVTNCNEVEYLDIPSDGKVMASMRMNDGPSSASFVISTGYFARPTSFTASVTSNIANGIGVNTTNRTFTILITGWYELSCHTSATVSAPTIVETAAYSENNGILYEWWNKKKYTATDGWKDSTLSDYPVYLEAGDVIDLRYLASTGVTITLGQITMVLKLI